MYFHSGFLSSFWTPVRRFSFSIWQVFPPLNRGSKGQRMSLTVHIVKPLIYTANESTIWSKQPKSVLGKKKTALALKVVANASISQEREKTPPGNWKQDCWLDHRMVLRLIWTNFSPCVAARLAKSLDQMITWFHLARVQAISDLWRLLAATCGNPAREANVQSEVESLCRWKTSKDRHWRFSWWTTCFHSSAACLQQESGWPAVVLIGWS